MVACENEDCEVCVERTYSIANLGVGVTNYLVGHRFRGITLGASDSKCNQERMKSGIAVLVLRRGLETNTKVAQRTTHSPGVHFKNSTSALIDKINSTFSRFVGLWSSQSRWSFRRLPCRLGVISELQKNCARKTRSQLVMLATMH